MILYLNDIYMHIYSILLYHILFIFASVPFLKLFGASDCRGCSPQSLSRIRST